MKREEKIKQLIDLIEFVDQNALLDLSTKEYKQVIKEVTEILGYNIF